MSRERVFAPPQVSGFATVRRLRACAVADFSFPRPSGASPAVSGRGSSRDRDDGLTPSVCLPPVGSHLPLCQDRGLHGRAFGDMVGRLRVLMWWCR